MIKGFGDMMKQAQQMQEQMQKMQEDIAAMKVSGQAGAGLVKVTMTGRHDVRNISIDDSLLNEDKEVLEDLIAAAVNDAVRRVETEQKDKFGGLASGLNFPPGFKMPF